MDHFQLEFLPKSLLSRSQKVHPEQLYRVVMLSYSERGESDLLKCKNKVCS